MGSLQNSSARRRVFFRKPLRASAEALTPRVLLYTWRLWTLRVWDKRRKKMRVEGRREFVGKASKSETGERQQGARSSPTARPPGFSSDRREPDRRRLLSRWELSTPEGRGREWAGHTSVLALPQAPPHTPTRPEGPVRLTHCTAPRGSLRTGNSPAWELNPVMSPDHWPLAGARNYGCSDNSRHSDELDIALTNSSGRWRCLAA